MAQDVLGEVAPSSFKYDVDQGKFFEGAVELTDAEAEKKGIDVDEEVWHCLLRCNQCFT